MKTEKSTREILKILSNLPSFQKNASDSLIIEMLTEEFPNVDIVEEAKKYLFWVIDQPQEKESGKNQKWNYRSRFRMWLQNTARKPRKNQ